MKCTVILFAGLQDYIKAEQLELELPAQATVGEARHQLMEQYPDAKALLSASFFAIDHDFVDDQTVITAEHEIAIIPPVSGG